VDGVHHLLGWVDLVSTEFLEAGEINVVVHL
jgi:hypothetical protein